MSRLRVAHLRLLVPFVVLGWRAALPVGDNSFLWHVRAGTVQLDAGEVLRVDPFSFTAAGEAWRTQSWMAELGYGWLENLTGGIGWVPTMKFLAMLVAVALVGLAIHRTGRGRSGVTLAGLFLLVWQISPFAVARPALLGSVLLTVVVAITYSDRRPLWLLPPLFWLWAGVHGMFVIGLGYLFLDAVRRRSRKQAVAVVLSGVATSLTAHGLGAWWILVQFLQNRGALDQIAEWLPPDFTDLFTIPLLIVIVGLIVAGAVGQLEPGDLWLIVPFVIFGVLAERNIWPAVIVLSPIAVHALHTRKEKVAPDRAEAVGLNWAIAVALIVVAVVGLTRPLELREDLFPSAAAVAALEQGPLFHGSAVGGYLIFADWPQVEVFIDDRAELYGADGFERFRNLRAGIDVQETFAELSIDQVIVTADWPIVDYLELLGWDYRYRDDHFVVMESSTS